MKNFELTRLRSQLADLVQQNQDLAEQVADERHSRVKNQAESALATQNVRAPRQLAQILLAENVLVERNGELRLRTEQGTFSIEEGLAELLASPDYEHYRSSATAKGAPGTVDPTPEIELKHLKNGVPSSEEMMTILADPGKSQEIFAELEELMRQPTTPARAASTGLTAGQPAYDSVRPKTQGQFSTSDLPGDQELLEILGDPVRSQQLFAQVEAGL